MLQDKRIKEAENNFKQYLRDGLIKKRIIKPEIITILKQNANESLILAKEICEKNKSDLWVVVISYYSMFYIANAAINERGWYCGERNVHKITSDLIIVLLKDLIKQTIVEEYESMMDNALANMKSDEIVISYDNERRKRGQFQYDMTTDIKHSKAKTSLKRAQEFYFEILKILK